MTQKAEQAEIEAKLRNERTNLRRLFTVSANTFDDIHHKIDKVKDIHVQYNKVVEKAERLLKVDDEIKECIIFTDEEYDTTESYRDRFTEIRVVYEKQYTQDESSSVVSKILKAWDRYRLNREDEEDDPVVSKDKVLENLMIFLRNEVEGEEHRFLAETSFGDGMKRKESRKPPLRDEPTAATLIANTSVGRNQCIFCERAHASQDCQKISNLAYEDRKGQVMRKRCCLVCLKPGYMAKRCHSSVKCLICGRRHYALLCPDLRKDKISSKSREVDEEQHSTETLLTNLPLERKIYLKTITVRLRHKNKEICVRALMDDGSHRSYIEKSLVAELDLSPSGTEVLSQGLFGGGISPSMEYGRFTVTVESLDHPEISHLLTTTTPEITPSAPGPALDMETSTTMDTNAPSVNLIKIIEEARLKFSILKHQEMKDDLNQFKNLCQSWGIQNPATQTPFVLEKPRQRKNSLPGETSKKQKIEATTCQNKFSVLSIEDPPEELQIHEPLPPSPTPEKTTTKPKKKHGPSKKTSFSCKQTTSSSTSSHNSRPDCPT
ncbi:transposable element Tc1 transposase [Nephila pilipes]|uniref:Transposable element Tc1 transposase n=1 Tax=Nephila pilipes TaxID=299642 RepID=A0A8X6R0B0_NEPPI|nr:transposable element Tc1 transposase [Nephila pilipes]